VKALRIKTKDQSSTTDWNILGKGDAVEKLRKLQRNC